MPLLTPEMKKALRRVQADKLMFKDDINEVPRFTDGTEITAKDLADMNINALDNIAELIGFELEE